MNDAVAGATVRPYQEQHVLIRGCLLHITAELVCRGYRLAIDFENHIATTQACIFRRATRLNLCNRHSLYIGGKIQLLTYVRSEIGDRNAEPGVTRLVSGVGRDFLVLVVFANRQVHFLGVTVAHHVQGDLRARRIFGDDHLQIASCFYRLAVHRGHHITFLQAGAARRGVRSYRSNQCTRVSSQVEELRVLRSDIVQSNSQVSVMNHTVLHQRIDNGTHRLAGDSKSRARKVSCVRDQEGVDADQLTMRIDQRATGVAGVNRSIGLNESAGLARIIPERIGPVDRADDAAGDRKLKLAERVANSQIGLSGNQLGRVTPGNRGQVFGVDLDHGQICKLVGANYLGREGPAVMQGDAYFHGSIDHVIVGHDVTIRGDDHAAANAMLNLPLPAAP